MTPPPSTVESIAAAIGTPSRRTVAKGAAWSLPAIAVGIAAPANAASPGTCATCAGSGPPQCILTPGGSGTCTCGPGLACVGTGPLGLANVCVGADIAPLVVTCGGSSCTGVCLAAGGAVITAFNTLATALGVAYVGLRGLSVLGDSLDSCTQIGTLPTDICVSPLNDGGLGSLCIQQFSCGNTLVIGTVLNTLNAAVNTFISALSAAGIVAASSCQAPYVCTGGASIAVDNDAGSIAGTTYAVRVNVGICQCGPANTCPGSAGGFEVAC